MSIIIINRTEVYIELQQFDKLISEVNTTE